MTTTPPAGSGYVATANTFGMLDKLVDALPFPPAPGARSPSPPPPPRGTIGLPPGFPLDILNVTSSTVTVASPNQSPTQITSAVSPGTEDYVVLPGPEDVLLFNSTNGLYQQSVTLTARMYPIEATAAKSIWGLPTLIWGILIGTIAILIVILATLFFCCWLQPRTRKLLSASYYTGSSVSHNSIVPKSQTSDSNQLVMPLSIGICPPQYSAPPPPTGSNSSGKPSNTTGANQQQQQVCSASGSSSIPCHVVNNPAAGHHPSKYGGSPQYSHQYHQQQPQQQQHQQQQYQHHHQCIHHQQQQQQQQYHAHYSHMQQQNSQYAQAHQQTLQQYYSQQQQQHQQQMQHQQQLSQYMHPSQQQQQQQQALQQQQQREQQIQQHHYHHQQQQQHHHQQGQLVHHKSMWAINPLYASSGVISDGFSGGGGGGCGSRRGDHDEEAGSTSYRTRSLPSWGKNKQRPLSNADDLEELYAKVNFSKKRRNRMRNDEAAIIALCRSRSQNLSALPMTDQDAVVVYDERTAL